MTLLKTVIEYNTNKINADEKRLIEDNMMGIWSEIYSLSDEKRELKLAAILAAQKSLDNGLVKLSIDGDKITWQYKNDAKSTTTDIGDNPTMDDWMTLGTEFHGIMDKERADAASGKFRRDENGEIIPYKKGEGASAERTAQRETPEDRVAADVKSIVTEDLISGNENSDIEKLKPLASALGYEVSKAFDGQNIVTLKVPGKDGAKLTITNDTTAKAIQDWMIANTDETRAANYIRTLPKEMEEGETLEERAAETTGSGSLDNLGQE